MTGGGGGHFGQNATLEKVSERYWWPGATKDIREYIKSCANCQKTNASNKAPAATLNPIPVKDLFHRWGIDLVGPLEETPRGNKYLIVATEYLSKWAEAKAIPDKSAAGVHDFLCELVSRYGACHVIIHDQGREFNNKAVENLCAELKINVAMSAAYHPQTNGFVSIGHVNISIFYL